MTGPVLCLVDIAHKESSKALLQHCGAMFEGRDVHVAYVMPYGFYSYVEPFVSEESQKAAADRARTELVQLIEAAGVHSFIPHLLRGGIGERVRLLEIDAHINDDTFADAYAETTLDLLRGVG